MRTFVFNLALLSIALLAVVLLLRPLVAAYGLATQPVAPPTQPSFVAPEQSTVGYQSDYDADFEFMPAGLSEQLPINPQQ
jgi:hypothetical protein